MHRVLAAVGELMLLTWAMQRSRGVGTPGTSGNYLSTPDSAANSITGDIDIRVRLRNVSWSTQASGGSILSKDDLGGQRSYGFQTGGAAGKLLFFYTPDGATITGRVATSTAVVPFADGASGWVRVTYATASGNTLFYTSYDGVTWAQLGTTVALTAGAIFNGTAKVTMGSDSGGTSLLLAATFLYAEIRNGIAGTVNVLMNPVEWLSGATWTSSTGEVWTLNGTAAIGY